MNEVFKECLVLCS